MFNKTSTKKRIKSLVGRKGIKMIKEVADKLVSDIKIITCDDSFNLKIQVELNVEYIQDLISLTNVHSTELLIGQSILEKLAQLNDNKSSKL